MPMGTRAFCHCPCFLHCCPHHPFSPPLPPRSWTPPIESFSPSTTTTVVFFLLPRSGPQFCCYHLGLYVHFQRLLLPLEFIHSCPSMPVIDSIFMIHVTSHLCFLPLYPPQSSPKCHHCPRQQWSILPAPQRWMPCVFASSLKVEVSRQISMVVV